MKQSLFSDLPDRFPELRLKPKAKGRIKKDINSSKARSQAQERAIAQRYKDVGVKGSRRVPGSGAFATLPGDIDGGKWFQGEAKQTRSGRLIVLPAWIKKIAKEAKDQGKYWWILHTWTAEDDNQPFTKCVTISEQCFFELLARLEAAENELEQN